MHCENYAGILVKKKKSNLLFLNGSTVMQPTTPKWPANHPPFYMPAQIKISVKGLLPLVLHLTNMNPTLYDKIRCRVNTNGWSLLFFSQGVGNMGQQSTFSGKPKTVFCLTELRMLIWRLHTFIFPPFFCFFLDIFFFPPSMISFSLPV